MWEENEFKSGTYNLTVINKVIQNIDGEVKWREVDVDVIIPFETVLNPSWSVQKTADMSFCARHKHHHHQQQQQQQQQHHQQQQQQQQQQQLQLHHYHQ